MFSHFLKVGIVSLCFYVSSSQSTDDPRNFTDDIWLPGFHFVPYPFNWINDPNGPFYDPIHGYYHLFYQYDDPRTWGHAISPNLVDWMQLPVALNRNEWYDAEADWSGSATVLNDENRSIILTVCNPEGSVFTAVPANRSDPYLREWAYSDDTNSSGISQPLFTPRVFSRDPTELLPLSEGSGYQLFVGTANGTLVYQVDSTDDVFSLTEWHPVGFAQINDIFPGKFWECPDIYKLTSPETGDIWVSKFSTHADHFYTGDYDEKTATFTPRKWDIEQPMKYNQDKHFYASKSFNDPVGVGATDETPRRVVFAWLQMTQQTNWTENWINALSVPRSIKLTAHGAALATYPIPEMSTLHYELLLENENYQLQLLTLPLNTSTSLLFDGVSGVMLDLEATVTLPLYIADNDLVCGFEFFANLYNESSYLRVPIAFHEAANVRKVRILVDASIVEVFLDEGDTSRGGATTYFYYPPSADYNHFGIYMSRNVPSIRNDTQPTDDIQTDDSNSFLDINVGKDSKASCIFDVHSVWSMKPFNFNTSLYVF